MRSARAVLRRSVARSQHREDRSPIPIIEKGQMAGLHHSPIPALLPSDCNGQTNAAQHSERKGVFEWSFFCLYALLLALITTRRVLWSDEMQAWLIARDSHSLVDLFHNLRYEGHPALWYLLLYVPAHISWNPVSMQVINYLFAVTEAWLILSARKLHWPVRALIVFSFFIFYNYGEIARSYMLTTLLLTAAVRCLLGERQRRKLAILFLALSINTHIFAIPVAATLALWAFCFSKLESRKDLGRLLRGTEFWFASVVLLASLAVAYLAVRPPSDSYAPHYGAVRHSLGYNLLLAEGGSWKAFLPATRDFMPPGVRDWLDPQDRPSVTASALSLALFLLSAGALSKNRSRAVFLVASTLVLIAMAATVHAPTLHHLGIIFDIFIIALLIDAYTGTEKTGRAWLPPSVATAAILAILSFQTLETVYASASAWVHPFSHAKETSSWLKQQGLDRNPLIIDGFYSLPVLGYMERASAYQSACSCVSSFAVWNTNYDADRSISLNDLENARGTSALPTILVKGYKLDKSDVQKLGLVEIHSFATNSAFSHGAYTVYEHTTP
jgi:hypothetical protein